MDFATCTGSRALWDLTPESTISFTKNFSVVISRLFLTDAMKSRKRDLYRCQALQQFDKLYEAFLHCIKRVQTPLPMNRFFTFVFRKEDVTRDGDDGGRKYITDEAVDDHDDASSDKTNKYGSDDDLENVADDIVERGGGGGGGERRRRRRRTADERLRLRSSANTNLPKRFLFSYQFSYDVSETSARDCAVRHEASCREFYTRD